MPVVVALLVVGFSRPSGSVYTPSISTPDSTAPSTFVVSPLTVTNSSAIICAASSLLQADRMSAELKALTKSIFS